MLVLFPQVSAPGGIERSCRHIGIVLADFAKEEKLALTVLSLNDPPGMHEFVQGRRSFGYEGFGRSKLCFAAAALRRRADLVFAGHVNLAPLGLLARRRGAVMVTMAWGIEVWRPLDPHRRLALRASNRVLAISRFTEARLLDAQTLDPSRVRLLNLALDPSYWDLARQDVIARPAILPGGPIILSVARLAADEQYKGIDTVIRSVARMRSSVPNVRYVVIGDGDDRARLSLLAQECGVADVVHFLGRVSEPDLVGAMAHCDVFTLPSKGEGFGIVFLEAMAFAKPVVGGKHGGISDIVQDGVTGILVEFGDVDATAHALETALVGGGQARTWGAAGRRRLEETFLFPRFERDLRACLREVVPTSAR